MNTLLLVQDLCDELGKDLAGTAPERMTVTASPFELVFLNEARHLNASQQQSLLLIMRTMRPSAAAETRAGAMRRELIEILSERAPKGEAHGAARAARVSKRGAAR
jgi:hypothetical protein